MATKTGLPTTREELVLMLINRKQPQARGTGACTYLHSINGGCAIGVAVSAATATKMEGKGNIAISKIIENRILPSRLEVMGIRFLETLQGIHDYKMNFWSTKNANTEAEIGSNGLIWNEDGVKEINHLIRTYDLKLEKIESLELV
jgi:hypothetical protein